MSSLGVTVERGSFEVRWMPRGRGGLGTPNTRREPKKRIGKLRRAENFETALTVCTT